MGALSKKELESKKKDLRKDGVSEVIDAQNVKEYVRRKRKKDGFESEDRYNMEETEEESELTDEVLDKLSIPHNDHKKLEEKIRQNKTKTKISIDQIDWKNVRTF